MRDSCGGGPRPPPKLRSDGGAVSGSASGDWRLSSGDLKENSWGSGKANPMVFSSSCKGEPLHGTVCDHMEEEKATPIVGKALFGSTVQHLRDEDGGGRRSTSDLHLEDSAGMVPAYGGWRTSSGDAEPASGGLARSSHISGSPPSGGIDVCMAEGEINNLPRSASPESGVLKVHALLRDEEVLFNNGLSDSATGKPSCGVLNEFIAQRMDHVSQGLNGNISDKSLMDGGNMQAADDLNSACLFQSTPSVRQYAPSTVEQQNPNSGNPTTSPRLWNSPTTVWNRPKVIPMPPKKDLGQLSLDGMTALLDDGEIDVALTRLNGALVGRMFGRKIPYPQLSIELKRRWERFGTFRLVTLSSDCFICLFDSAAARDAVLMEGPWVLFGQVLGLDRWSPSFSPSSLDGFLTPVWVRMPELPFFCWTATNIARIVSLIGEPLWIDSATDRLERGLFARACVRLDLSKPLKAGLWIEGKLGKFFQPLVYEGLSSFCFRCSQVGHKVNSCKMPVTKTTEVPCPKVPLPKVVSARQTSLDTGREGLQEDGISGQMLGQVEANSEGSVMPILDHVEAVSNNNAVPQTLDDRGAGPWMMVARKKRPNKGKAFANHHIPMVQVNATGPVWLKKIATDRGKEAILANKSSQKPLYVKSFEKQGHANSGMHNINGAQPAFGGFKALATSSMVNLHANSGMHSINGAQPAFGGFKALATSSVVNLNAQCMDFQVNGMGAALPPVLHSPCSHDLVVSSCTTPKPSMHVGEHSSAVPEPDISSSPHDALVLYNQDDRMRCGTKSLKKEKMLNDLGPVSLTPRKRRMIALIHDGGDASPLLTS